MKTSRLAALVVGLLTLGSLVYAEKSTVPAEPDALSEKMNALQQVLSGLVEDGYPLVIAKPEVLEKKLARVMNLSAAEVSTLITKGLASSDPLVKAQALLSQAELSKADASFEAAISAHKTEPKLQRLAQDGRGMIAASKSDHVTALKHYQNALDLHDKATEPLEWSYSAAKVASRLAELAKHKEAAEPLLREVLRLQEEKLGPQAPTVAATLTNLAWLLRDTNHLAEAEHLLRRALAIDETSFGKDHPNVAIRLHNLEGVLKATNRLAEAEPLMRRALAIAEASFGKNHRDVRVDLNDLARLLQQMNRPAEAEPLYRRALAIAEASFDKDNPNLGLSLNDLARFLQATNRPEEAAPLMQEAVRIFDKSVGKDDQLSISTRKDLEIIQKQLKK